MHTLPFPGPRPDAASPRPIDRGFDFLITSYMLGAPDGSNLGVAGYSHEFVARLFRPLLQRWGTVTDIRHPRRELDAAVAASRHRGRQPVHVSVLPLQDVYFAADAFNVVMPAWEFPDVPNHAFDGNPQNDWPAAARRADMLMVSGPFTADAFLRAGTTTPLAIVPVPTPDAYFHIPAWRPGQATRLDHWAFLFPGRDEQPAEAVVAPPPAPGRRLGRRLERSLSAAARELLGTERYERISRRLKEPHRRQPSAPMDFRSLPYPQVDALELSGVVYTSIFNPSDGRKNWIDLLNAFLVALADRPDATLVIKLIAKSPAVVRQVIDYYLHRNLPHRCTVAFLCDFLSEAEMLRLCAGSTYYLQATKAEGNCLPLMNYLAAARPGISPDHSSMGDYFGPDLGFIVASHPEPSAWPHDRRLRLRTTWGRIVWPSLRDQIAESYRVAVARPTDYAAMARDCRTAMQAWASYPAVAERLDAALRTVLGIAPAATTWRAAA